MLSYKEEIAAGIKASGLTLERVGKRCESNKSYISGLRSGAVNPPSAKMSRRLAKVLGLNGDRLMALAVLEKRPRALSLRALANVVDELLADEAERITAAAEVAREGQAKAS